MTKSTQLTKDSGLSVLNKATLEATPALSARFNNALPFRHIVIDDFFKPSFCQSLLDSFPSFNPKHARDENGNIGRKATIDDIRKLGPTYKTLDTVIKSPVFLQWLGQVTGIDSLLYDPDYFGGGTHENRHGQDLDPHVDFNKHPLTGHHRRLNLIVYLNHEWNKEWGGNLELHKDPRLDSLQNEVKTIMPLFNRCVIFETTFWSWHGFEGIKLPQGDDDERSRKSVALYFYSKERPETEQTKPHSTIYVERPLPEHIKAGVTLSEDDYQHIKVLLARRDQHLQRLYNNISQLSAHVEGLENMLSNSNRPRWKRVLRRLAIMLARI